MRLSWDKQRERALLGGIVLAVLLALYLTCVILPFGGEPVSREVAERQACLTSLALLARDLNARKARGGFVFQGGLGAYLRSIRSGEVFRCPSQNGTAGSGYVISNIRTSEEVEALACRGVVVLVQDFDGNHRGGHNFLAARSDAGQLLFFARWEQMEVDRSH